jgi:hypothetical protein
LALRVNTQGENADFPKRLPTNDHKSGETTLNATDVR